MVTRIVGPRLGHSTRRAVVGLLAASLATVGAPHDVRAQSISVPTINPITLLRDAIAKLLTQPCQQLYSPLVQLFGAPICFNRSDANNAFQQGTQDRLVGLRALGLTFVTLGAEDQREQQYQDARDRQHRSVADLIEQGIGTTVVLATDPVRPIVTEPTPTNVPYTLNTGALTNLAFLVLSRVRPPPTSDVQVRSMLVARSFALSNAMDSAGRQVRSQLATRDSTIRPGDAYGSERGRLDGETSVMGTYLGAVTGATRAEQHEAALLDAFHTEQQWQLTHLGAPIVFRGAY